MKNIRLFFLAFLILQLAGCSATHIFWITQSDLDSDQFGQQMRLGRIRSEIPAVVEVTIKPFIYPDPGTGSGAFVSHRAAFWIPNEKESQNKDGSPNYQKFFGGPIKPFGVLPVRVSSSLLCHHYVVAYCWQDRFGRLHHREVPIKIYPGSSTDELPQFEIVLVENPGRDPIREH